jgi:hypothetical protein
MGYGGLTDGSHSLYFSRLSHPTKTQLDWKEKKPGLLNLPFIPLPRPQIKIWG